MQGDEIDKGIITTMTSKRDNCGIGSLLPLSCRDRAEAFARSLQTRLSTLGTHQNHHHHHHNDDDDDDPDSRNEERSWLGPTTHDQKTTLTLSQPHLHVVNNQESAEVFLATLEPLESPCSPQDEFDQNELQKLLNKNDLYRENNKTIKQNGDCQNCLMNQHSNETNAYFKAAHLNGSNGRSGGGGGGTIIDRHYSADSDGEVFYDLDEDPLTLTPPYNNITNGDGGGGGCGDGGGGTKVNSKDSESDETTGIDVHLNHGTTSNSTSSSNSCSTNQQHNSDCLFATSLDCTPQQSISDDLSAALSIKNNDNGIADENGEEIEEEEEDDILIVEVTEDGRNEIKIDEVGKVEQNGTTTKTTPPRNEETDCKVICDGNEGYSNGEILDDDEQAIENNEEGEEESNTYITSFTVNNELIMECVIDKSEEELQQQQNGQVIIIEENHVEENNEDEDVNADEEDEDDDDDTVIPRVRRCSSLKTGKTPPGTPGRKKIVRFADVLGLDLADVRTFLDEVPKVPKSAYDDLSDCDISESNSDIQAINALNKYHGIKIDRILVPLFEQPSSSPHFLDLVRDNLVCLENAVVDDPVLFLIKGTVRVRNLDFHKSVHVRYTLNGWKTFADVQGVYVNNSCDGFSDRFSFVIYAHTLTVGQKLEFACRFQCKGCQYWDSNKGLNYCFQCLPSASSTTVPISINHGHCMDDWGASFY